MRNKYFKYILLIIISFFAVNSSVMAVVTSDGNSSVSKKFKVLEGAGGEGKNKKCSTLKLKQKELWLIDPKKHDANCLYAIDTEHFDNSVNTFSTADSDSDGSGSCYIVQLSFNDDKVFSESGSFKDNASKIASAHGDTKAVIGKLSNRCPDLYVTVGTGASYNKFYNVHTSDFDHKKFGFDNIGTSIPLYNDYFDESKIKKEVKVGSDEAMKKYRSMTCKEALGDDLIDLLQSIINGVKILVPVLLIVYGTMDFVKAMLSYDEGKMKEAQKRFIKRVIIAIAFFLIPAILTLILNIANSIWGNIDTTICGIKF